MDKNALITSGKYCSFLGEKKELYQKGFSINRTKSDYIYFLDHFSEEEAKECIKIYNADKLRKYRLFNRVVEWFYAVRELGTYQDNKMVFFTLTFNDEDLKNTNKETRRKYVERFLKENSISYVANIDYGKENGREHYHALAVIEEDIDIKKWKRISWIETVPKKSKDLRKITKYILKLTNHSYKESTRREKAIYSKNNDLLKFYLEQNKEDLQLFKTLIKQKIL